MAYADDLVLLTPTAMAMTHSKDFFVKRFIFVYHGRFMRGRILRVRPLLYVRACCSLVRTTLHYRRKNFLPLLAILLIIDVIDVARFISIFIISLRIQ